MKMKRKKPTVLYGLIVLTICFIWGNSLMPASVSGAIIDRKLNVAITRARKQMIMTGNPEILRNNQIFNQLMDYVKEKGGYFQNFTEKVW